MDKKKYLFVKIIHYNHTFIIITIYKDSIKKNLQKIYIIQISFLKLFYSIKCKIYE